MTNDDIAAAGVFALGMVGEQLAEIAGIQLREAGPGERPPTGAAAGGIAQIRGALASIATGRPAEFPGVVGDMLASLAVMLLAELGRRDGVPVDDLYVRLVPPPEGWKWLDKDATA
jgi:hypothetical protein